MADQKNPRCDGMGNSKGDHCCYLSGSPCPHLLIDDPDNTPRKYVCGLLKELKVWNKVHTDPRYLADVKPHWLASGAIDCGDWPGDVQAIRDDIANGLISPDYGCCMTRDLVGTITWPPGSGSNGGNPNQ